MNKSINKLEGWRYVIYIQDAISDGFVYVRRQIIKVSPNPNKAKKFKSEFDALMFIRCCRLLNYDYKVSILMKRID